MKRVFIFLLPALLFSFIGCKKEVGPTEITVVDSIRHYYPMVLGEELKLSYVLQNKGREPLVINDIHSSCGCILADENNEHIVFPGKDLPLNFIYDSSKNLGHVSHVIRVYGNIKPRGVLELRFDVNVVPPADFTPDYEQTYEKKLKEERKSGLKEAVDGKASQKGYYVDDANVTDSRTQSKYPWRE